MLSSGTLQVRAITSRAQIPVEGATVTVALELPGGGRELISLQRTDQSGLTRPITITTPAVSNSQTPDQAQGWTDVTITISSPGYDGIVVSSAQIFPGVESFQQMVMIPETDTPDSSGPERYDIPNQGL